MEKSDFLKILQKYLDGTATEEEQQFIFSYYKLFDSEPNVLNALDEKERNHLKRQIQKSIWDRIDQDEKEEKNKSLGVRSILQIAAAILVLVMCTTGIFFLSQYTDRGDSIIVKVEKWEQNRLVYLPDGSSVLVHSGTELCYPVSFDDLTRRQVSIKGEAFFDIQHNPNKPFVVHSGKITTTVLGTAFNVEAYPAEENILITVSSGRVKVADKNKVLSFLCPNEQLIYNKNKETTVKRKFDGGFNLDLKNQDLLVQDMSLAEAAKLLEKKYDVSIIIKNESLRSKHFSTTFLKNESLEEVLKSICEFTDAIYHLEKDKTVVIIKKNH